jgi:hypothetical protein
LITLSPVIGIFKNKKGDKKRGYPGPFQRLILGYGGE